MSGGCESESDSHSAAGVDSAALRITPTHPSAHEASPKPHLAAPSLAGVLSTDSLASSSSKRSAANAFLVDTDMSPVPNHSGARQSVSRTRLGLRAPPAWHSGRPPQQAMAEKPENIPEGDFANYFCTYGHVPAACTALVASLQSLHRVLWMTLQLCPSRRFLYHQKEMLEDQVRMQAYYDAVHKNKSSFEGKARGGRGGGAATFGRWRLRLPTAHTASCRPPGCPGRGHGERHPGRVGSAGGSAQGVRR